MIIGLYTSRLVLNILGVDDYGIYTIVGGFVAFFSIISGSLVATTQRFITVELGKVGDSNPRKIFSAAMTIHIILASVLLLLFETVGLYVLNCQLNIPTDRYVAANWAFQFSLFSFLINIISSPYTAVIIAYERMSAFAFISLFDSILKLLLVLLLYIIPTDKLVVYSLFILSISLIDRVISSVYCRRQFDITRFVLVKEKRAYKEILGFSGMNFLGTFASILSNQGMDILLNLFFGVRINAARGIANQVQSAVGKFENDFLTALDPQITKEYSAGNKLASQSLCFMGAKFSVFLMFLIGMPIIFKAPCILGLWLGKYPEYAVPFLRYSMILAFFTVLSKPLVTEILATGNLKKTVLWIGSSIITTVPIAYIFFHLGFGPEYSYIILIAVEILTLNVRLLILEEIAFVNFVFPFYKEVLLRVLFVSIILSLINTPLSQLITDDFVGIVLYTLLSATLGLIVIILIGLKNSERKAIYSYVQKKIGHVK
jgi:O-antigen/teichoic acid export membrane protein